MHHFPPPQTYPNALRPRSFACCLPRKVKMRSWRNTLSVVHRPIAVNIDPTGKGFIRPDPLFRSLPCAASLGRHLSRCPVRVHGPGI